MQGNPIFDICLKNVLGDLTVQLDRFGIRVPVRIDSSKIELMAYRCLIKNRTENLMRRSQIEEEVEFGVAPRIVDAYR